jgi:hypothetical protein
MLLGLLAIAFVLAVLAVPSVLGYAIGHRTGQPWLAVVPLTGLLVLSLLVAPIVDAMQPARCRDQPDCIQGAGFGYALMWITVLATTCATAVGVVRARHRRRLGGRPLSER